ncbi:MAG: hypothetical protein AB8B86_02345 [Pseudomonadales bacterium]
MAKNLSIDSVKYCNSYDDEHELQQLIPKQYFSNNAGIKIKSTNVSANVSALIDTLIH